MYMLIKSKVFYATQYFYNILDLIRNEGKIICGRSYYGTMSYNLLLSFLNPTESQLAGAVSSRIKKSVALPILGWRFQYEINPPPTTSTLIGKNKN